MDAGIGLCPRYFGAFKKSSYKQLTNPCLRVCIFPHFSHVTIPEPFKSV